MNQNSPWTQSKAMNPARPTTPAAMNEAKMKPRIMALGMFQLRPPKSRTSTARTSVTMIEPMTAIPIQSVPFEKSSQLRLYGQGQLKGAVQPPKKSVAMSAETMKTLTYSAKKKKPKRIPEYSVAKPATSSESASVMSNGVRLASAVAAMKKISADRGCLTTNQSKADPDCASTMWFMLIVPARITTPTAESVNGIS